MKFIEVEQDIDKETKRFVVRANNIVSVLLYEDPYPEDKEKAYCVLMEVLAGDSVTKIPATKFYDRKKAEQKYNDILEVLSKI